MYNFLSKMALEIFNIQCKFDVSKLPHNNYSSEFPPCRYYTNENYKDAFLQDVNNGILNLHLGIPMMEYDYIQKKQIGPPSTCRNYFNEDVYRVEQESKIVYTVYTISNKSILKSIPNVILKLKHLKHINLSCNHISKIDFEFYNLTNLRYLNLSKNKINNIAIEINKLVNLEYLNLSKNNILILPNLNGLLKLKRLDLSYNQPIIISDNITNLSNLIELNLSGCNIQTLADNLINLSKLECLYLDNIRNITAFPTFILKLTNLKRLSLQYCCITKIPCLKNLDLEYFGYSHLYHCRYVKLPYNLQYIKDINIKNSCFLIEKMSLDFKLHKDIFNRDIKACEIEPFQDWRPNLYLLKNLIFCQDMINTVQTFILSSNQYSHNKIFVNYDIQYIVVQELVKLYCGLYYDKLINFFIN